MNSQKYVFLWEKWNFESIGNSANTAEFLALKKALETNYFVYNKLQVTRHYQWNEGEENWES